MYVNWTLMDYGLFTKLPNTALMLYSSERKKVQCVVK